VELHRALGRRPYGWVDLTGFAFSTLFVLYFFWTTLPSIAYDKLLEASVWYRWNDLRRWVGVIRVLKKVMLAPIPDFELDFRLASALAAEGNLAQALDLVKKYEEHSVGKFQYYSRLATLYSTARDYDRMLEFQRKSAEHGAGKPEEQLDIALTLLRRHRQPEPAAKILLEIDPSTCSDLVGIYHLYCLGLLAVETNDWPTAEETLRQSIEAAQPYATNVLFVGLLQEIRAYLCIAQAHLEKKTEAAALLRKITPLLKARQEHELLERCRIALDASKMNFATAS
jgi:tetratricopeptide (TPR) repeat protein